MATVRFPSKEGLKAAKTGVLAAVAMVVVLGGLTVPAHVLWLITAAVAISAASYMARWAARGRSDGR